MDPQRGAEDLTTKAVLGVARRKAERALEDALSTEEERAAREAEASAAARKQRTRLLVRGGVALVLVLGAIGLVLHYWHWFLLAGLAAAGALYARHRWQQRRAARARRAGLTGEGPARDRRTVRGEGRGAPALESARAVEPAPDAGAPSVDDELAALKARLGK